MKKSERQVIFGLAAVIVVVAVIFGFMFMKNRDNSTADDSLKEAVQEEESSDELDTSTAQEEIDEGSTEDLAMEPAIDTESTENTEPLPETTEEQTSSKSVMDAADGYLFPDSDTSYISSSGLSKLTTTELQYAINEIYARHGLKFTKKENKERFEKKKWYRGTVDDQESISLNTYEKKNVDVLASELKKRGAR